MEIIYTLHQQYTFDEDRLEEIGYTQQDLLNMSDENIIDLMVDLCRDGGDTEHAKCDFELLGEDYNELKSFSKDL